MLLDYFLVSPEEAILLSFSFMKLYKNPLRSLNEQISSLNWPFNQLQNTSVGFLWHLDHLNAAFTSTYCSIGIQCLQCPEDFLNIMEAIFYLFCLFTKDRTAVFLSHNLFKSILPFSSQVDVKWINCEDFKCVRVTWVLPELNMLSIHFDENKVEWTREFQNRIKPWQINQEKGKKISVNEEYPWFLQIVLSECRSMSEDILLYAANTVNLNITVVRDVTWMSVYSLHLAKWRPTLDQVPVRHKLTLV